MQLIKKTIVWKDTKEEVDVIFGIGDFNEELDEQIFYYVDELTDLNSLMDENGVEDFYIKSDVISDFDIDLVESLYENLMSNAYSIEDRLRYDETQKGMEWGELVNQLQKFKIK